MNGKFGCHQGFSQVRTLHLFSKISMMTAAMLPKTMTPIRPRIAFTFVLYSSGVSSDFFLVRLIIHIVRIVKPVLVGVEKALSFVSFGRFEKFASEHTKNEEHKGYFDIVPDKDLQRTAACRRRAPYGLSGRGVNHSVPGFVENVPKPECRRAEYDAETFLPDFIDYEKKPDDEKRHNVPFNPKTGSLGHCIACSSISGVVV